MLIDGVSELLYSQNFLTLVGLQKASDPADVLLRGYPIANAGAHEPSRLQRIKNSAGKAIKSGEEAIKTIWPRDPELVKKTLTRIDEQDKWNEVFSTTLIKLLDNIDLLKSEMRERMRSAESITQTATANQLNAARLFRTAVQYSALAVAMSWIATAWMAWFALRPAAPLCAACAASVFAVVAAGLIAKCVKHEA